MRAALQKVKKFTRVSYLRKGVFGNGDELEEEPAELEKEFTQVLLSCSMEEAELILQVLQQTSSNELHGRWFFEHAEAASKLSAELRKLTHENGVHVFEPPTKIGTPWHLHTGEDGLCSGAPVTGQDG